MSYDIGDVVEFDGNKAVVTSATDSGYDVAAETETSGGRCRQIHLDVSGSRLSDYPEPGRPDPIEGPTVSEE